MSKLTPPTAVLPIPAAIGSRNDPAPSASHTKAAAPDSVPGIPAALVHFDSLPDSAYVRLPVVVALRGISPATVWRHVKAGILPAPVKLGPNTTAWNVGALRRAA